MSSKQEVSLLKRRFVRARTGTTAFVLRRVDDSSAPIAVDEGIECFGPLIVENLSAGGALLLGGGDWRVGQTVELELQLKRGSLVRARAVVVRLEPHRSPVGVALQFQDLPKATELAIQDVVCAAIERLRLSGRKVVVVTPATDDSTGLGPSIEALGMEAVLVPTLLDALRWLQDPRVVVSALMIDERAEGDTGLDALAWCADAFPGLRRVLMAHEQDPDQPRDPRRRAAHAILLHPFEPRRLARALGVRATRQETQREWVVGAWTERESRGALVRPALSTIPVPAP